MRSELTRALRAARAEWDAKGMISYFTAALLMRMGVIVPELEAQWSRTAHG